MWELFILAKDKPYPHLTDSQVVDDAVNRGTNRWLHSRPDPCPEAVYDVMQHCWIANPKERATFESLHGMLQKLPAYCLFAFTLIFLFVVLGTFYTRTRMRGIRPGTGIPGYVPPPERLRCAYARVSMYVCAYVRIYTRPARGK